MKPIDNDLIKAARRDNIPEVKRLLAVGADLHAEDDYALVLASENGHLEVIKVLYSHAKKIGKPFGKDLFKYYKDILPKNTKLNRVLYPDYEEHGEYLV